MLKRLVVVVLLVLALPLGVYLSQRKQIYKSKASSPGDCRCSGRSIICEVDNGDGTTRAEWKGDDPSCTEGTPPSFTKVENETTGEITTIIESVNVIGNNAGVVAKPQESAAPVATTPPIENVCFLPGMNCVGDDWTYGVELAKKPGQALKDNKNPSLIAKLKEQIKDPEFAKNNTAVVNALVEQDESLKQTVGTQTSAPISDAAKKLLEEKNKECSQTTGLCPMIDPDTLAVVGWVPSDKAVFGNYQQAIIARSNLSIGDTTTQVKIGNNTYTLANPDFKFDITAEEASKIKELADKQKIGSDTNNRAVLDPAKYDLGKIQKQLEDFEAQRIEAEKAIADQILQTGDKKYFEYLSPEMKKQVDEILKKNADIKRAADAALRGDNSAKDKLSDADQAKVEEIVKDAKEQETYLKNKVEALAKETDPEIRAQILSGLNESQKKYVEEAAAQIALVNEQNEEIRQKNIDIVAQQIAQVDRDSTLSDDQKSAEFEKVSNQLESDSEAIKLATSKAVQQITKEQETIKIQEQKIANIKIDLDLAKQATSGNKTFDDAVKIITGIANGEIKTDTLAKLIYGQITQANNRPGDPLADLLSLRPGAQVAKLTLSDPTLPQNQELIAKSLDSPALQLKLKENYYTDLVNNYYSASDKSSCVWGVSSSCEQIKEKIDKYKADLPPEQIRNIYKQALIKNITNLDNNSIAVKEALVKTLSESRIGDLELDVDKTLVETTNLGIKDWQDYQKLNDNWTYLAYSYGSGQQFSNNIQQTIESGQVKPAEVEKRIIEIAGSDPVSFILAQYEVARKEYISKNQKDPGYNPTTKEYWEASFSSLSKAVPIMAATGYNIFTQGGAQRNLVSQSVGYEQKRQEYIQKYNVDPGYDPTKLEYWKANTEAWAGGLVNTVPVVTNGVVGLFSEEMANKYVPVTEYQRNSADYIRAGVAFAAPAASVIAPIAALPFAPLGVVGILTTGQTAFGSYASLGSLGNTAELCTFRPDMDRVGCGLAFGNTVYMVGNTISGLARGTISIAQAQVAKDVALVNKNTTFQQALKIVKGGASVKAAALNAGSPIERIAYSLSSGAGAATFIPKALLSCTGAATQQQGASWADCIVSGTMGGASVFRSLNLFLPFTRNDAVGRAVGWFAEGGDMLDGFASCADLSFNPGNKDPIRTNPGDCILGLYDAFGDNLAKGSALFGQQDRTVTNGSFAKLQAAINAKDEALIKQYTAEAISNLGHLQANNISVNTDLSNADAAIDRLKQEYQKQFLLNISKDIKNPEIEKLRTLLNTTSDFPTVALNLTTAILTSNPKIFTADQLKELETELKSQINNLTAQADVISDQIEALQTAEVVAQPEIDRLQALKNALEKRTFELFNRIAYIGIARFQVTQAPPPATTVTGDKSQETDVETWQTNAVNFAKTIIGGISIPQIIQNWRDTQTQPAPATTVTGVVNEIKTYLTTGQNSWTVAGNDLLKQLENSRAIEIVANVIQGPTKYVGEKLSDGINAITQALARPGLENKTQKPADFVEYFLNGKKYTDPSLPQQLLSDHFSIKSKYDLPKRDIRFENPSEYIRQLREIARKNNIPIRDKSEFQQFFDENPIAGAVYDGKGRQIFVDLSKDPIALAGDLEHELIHALQHIKYPGLPIELQEYEAYVGANMRIGEDFLNDPENVAVVWGQIGMSVQNWYKNEKLPVPWGTTQQSPTTGTANSNRTLPLQNAGKAAGSFLNQQKTRFRESFDKLRTFVSKPELSPEFISQIQSFVNRLRGVDSRGVEPLQPELTVRAPHRREPTPVISIANRIVTAVAPHIPLMDKAFGEIGSQALGRLGNFVNTITQAFARQGLENKQIQEITIITRQYRDGVNSLRFGNGAEIETKVNGIKAREVDLPNGRKNLSQKIGASDPDLKHFVQIHVVPKTSLAERANESELVPESERPQIRIDLLHGFLKMAEMLRDNKIIIEGLSPGEDFYLIAYTDQGTALFLSQNLGFSGTRDGDPHILASQFSSEENIAKIKRALAVLESTQPTTTDISNRTLMLQNAGRAAGTFVRNVATNSIPFANAFTDIGSRISDIWNKVTNNFGSFITFAPGILRNETQPATPPQTQETGTVTGQKLAARILGQWNIDLNSVPQEIGNIITDNIFDPGFAGRLASQENKTAEDGEPIPVVRSSQLSALISAGAHVIATVDIPDVRAENDKSRLDGDYYIRKKIRYGLNNLPVGTVVIRKGGDEFVFINLNGEVPNAKNVLEGEFRISTDTPIRPFSKDNIDISNFYVHHPEFTNLDLNLQKFLTVAFEDMVLKDPRAFRDYKHMLIHLQYLYPGVTEFTTIKYDTPVYTKTKNDIESEAAGDETIRQLAALIPGATIFRDGAVIYFVVPKGTQLAPVQNSTYTVTYPNRETFTYPLNLFTSSSEFTLSAESFNQARSTTSNDIQSQIDAYVKSLSPDDPWLRNIYYNPLTSRGLANLRARGTSESEIERLKNNYRSAGTNTETKKEAFVWDDKARSPDIRSRVYDVGSWIVRNIQGLSIVGGTTAFLIYSAFVASSFFAPLQPPINVVTPPAIVQQVPVIQQPSFSQPAYTAPTLALFGENQINDNNPTNLVAPKSASTIISANGTEPQTHLVIYPSGTIAQRRTMNNSQVSGNGNVLIALVIPQGNPLAEPINNLLTETQRNSFEQIVKQIKDTYGITVDTGEIKLTKVQDAKIIDISLNSAPAFANTSKAIQAKDGAELVQKLKDGLQKDGFDLNASNIKYTLDQIEAKYNYNLSIGIDEKVQCVNWVMMLASKPDSPFFYVGGQNVVNANQLVPDKMKNNRDLLQVDIGGATANRTKEYYRGDLVVLYEGDQGTQNHILAIVDTKIENGVTYYLVSDANRSFDAQGNLIEDGQIRTRWMTKDEFTKYTLNAQDPIVIRKYQTQPTTLGKLPAFLPLSLPGLGGNIIGSFLGPIEPAIVHYLATLDWNTVISNLKILPDYFVGWVKNLQSKTVPQVIVGQEISEYDGLINKLNFNRNDIVKVANILNPKTETEQNYWRLLGLTDKSIDIIKSLYNQDGSIMDPLREDYFSFLKKIVDAKQANEFERNILSLYPKAIELTNFDKGIQFGQENIAASGRRKVYQSEDGNFVIKIGPGNITELITFIKDSNSDYLLPIKGIKIIDSGNAKEFALVEPFITPLKPLSVIDWNNLKYVQKTGLRNDNDIKRVDELIAFAKSLGLGDIYLNQFGYTQEGKLVIFDYGFIPGENWNTKMTMAFIENYVSNNHQDQTKSQTKNPCEAYDLWQIVPTAYAADGATNPCPFPKWVAYQAGKVAGVFKKKAGPPPPPIDEYNKELQNRYRNIAMLAFLASILRSSDPCSQAASYYDQLKQSAYESALAFYKSSLKNVYAFDTFVNNNPSLSDSIKRSLGYFGEAIKCQAVGQCVTNIWGATKKSAVDLSAGTGLSALVPSNKTPKVLPGNSNYKPYLEIIKKATGEYLKTPGNKIAIHKQNNKIDEQWAIDFMNRATNIRNLLKEKDYDQAVSISRVAIAKSLSESNPEAVNILQTATSGKLSSYEISYLNQIRDIDQKIKNTYTITRKPISNDKIIVFALQITQGNLDEALVLTRDYYVYKTRTSIDDSLINNIDQFRTMVLDEFSLDIPWTDLTSAHPPDNYNGLAENGYDYDFDLSYYNRMGEAYHVVSLVNLTRFYEPTIVSVALIMDQLIAGSVHGLGKTITDVAVTKDLYEIDAYLSQFDPNSPRPWPPRCQ